MTSRGTLLFVACFYLLAADPVRGTNHVVPPTSCPQPYAVDVGFILDGTVSTSWFKMKQFVSELGRKFDLGLAANQSQIGVITYTDVPTLQFNFTAHTNTDSLALAMTDIARPSPRDTVGTSRALELAGMNGYGGNNGLFTASEGQRAGVRYVVFLVTEGPDGKTTVDTANMVAAADVLKNNGVEIYTIGVGIGATPGSALDTELSAITTDNATHKKLSTDFFNHNFAETSAFVLEIKAGLLSCAPPPTVTRAGESYVSQCIGACEPVALQQRPLDFVRIRTTILWDFAPMLTDLQACAKEYTSAIGNMHADLKLSHDFMGVRA